MPLLEVRWMLDRLDGVLDRALHARRLAAAAANTAGPRIRSSASSSSGCATAAFCGILPFALSTCSPTPLGAVPGDYQKMSVLSLALIPLTLAYAIVRYRLMDVDIIFRRGYAYTLATICVLAAFYGLVFSLGSLVQKNFKDLGNTGVMTVMLIGAFLFQPIRNWIQERLDRHFYRDRYDYRRTLVEFARELSSETDLDTHALLGRRAPAGDALDQAPGLLPGGRAGRSAAVPPEEGDGLESAPRQRSATTIWTSASSTGSCPRAYLFFERTRHQLDAVSHSWPAVRAQDHRRSRPHLLPALHGARPDHRLPRRQPDRPMAITSRAWTWNCCVTLAGYVGIAIENATLYRSLQRKVEEYERLKEFSENIVESINVGILAADLDDRVESWNTQIEQLSGVHARERARAAGCASCSPTSWRDQFDRVRGETGIHHIYKFVLKPAAAATPSTERPTGTGTCHGVPAAVPRIHSEHRHRAAGLERPGADRPPHHLRRRHRPRRTRAAAGAGRQAVAASDCWPPAWRTRSTRRWRSSPPTRRCSPSRWPRIRRSP